MNSEHDESDPAAELAAARAQIARARQYAGPLLAPVWDVLARIVRVLAAVVRARG